jgi:GrpB-like predicted nucleotidyltransferase (UPF0157 family)
MARIAIAVLVAVHFAVAVWHGNAHTVLAIALPPEKNAFVYVVIVIAPVVAAALTWTRYALVGVWTFFLSMLGALLFGAYHHFIMISPDNIGHLPHGTADAQSTFIVTAVALALLELASALHGAFCLGLVAYPRLFASGADHVGLVLQIVPYDPDWPAAFEAEAGRIRAALGNLALRIDHHGSTSVPGLAAKPIIDIQVSVAALQPLAAYRERLETVGYVHVPHPDDSFCPFFHRPRAWPHTHHVHVVERGGLEERRTLAFRDYLRDHPAVAREYERLKDGLARRFAAADPESREAYARAKTGFVEGIVATALSRGYPKTLDRQMEKFMPTFERVIPVLTYRDIPSAHDFLVRAFGFAAGGVHRTPEGQPIHGEVRVGDAPVWLHRVDAEHHLDSPCAVDVATSGLVVHVDDVDAHYQHARGAGAQIDSAPVDQPYGQREYGAWDLEGHRWWFAGPVKTG